MCEPVVPTTFRVRPSAGRVQIAIRVVGLCLFTVYLLRGPAGVEATVEQLRGLQPQLWLLACLCNLVPPLAIALRLKCLLRGVNHDVSYLALARDSLRATALNTVTLMGTGDLYRLNRMRVHGVPLVTGSALAVLDRLFGVGALAVTVVTLQITGVGRALDGSRAAIGIAALLLVFLLIGFVGMRGRLEGWMRRRFSPLVAVLGARGFSWPLLAQATALSFVACGAWILCVYFLGQGLELPVPMIAYFEAAPLVALATFIPITIGGVGLREAGYVLLLGSYGVNPTACVALGIAQYSTFLGVAALGALLFALPERVAQE